MWQQLSCSENIKDKSLHTFAPCTESNNYRRELTCYKIKSKQWEHEGMSHDLFQQSSSFQPFFKGNLSPHCCHNHIPRITNITPLFCHFVYDFIYCRMCHITAGSCITSYSEFQSRSNHHILNASQVKQSGGEEKGFVWNEKLTIVLVRTNFSKAQSEVQPNIKVNVHKVLVMVTVNSRVRTFPPFTGYHIF